MHWADLLAFHNAQLTDQLVLHTSSITQVLSKFEEPRFIHCYITAAAADAAVSDAESGDPPTSRERVMMFELPRYGLEFELVGGSLVSLDYRGYRLASQQQLVSPVVSGYTLPDFQQYLILETHDLLGATAVHRAGTRVLIPAGSITAHTQVSGKGRAGVFVQVPPASGAELKVRYRIALLPT